MTEITHLTIEEFCAYVPGMNRQRAAKLRHAGLGPEYVKPAGTRLVLYPRASVDEWLETSLRASTRELA